MPGDRPGPGAVLADRLRVVDVLGEGGVATVYRVVDAAAGPSGAERALKVLHEQRGEALARLRREGRLQATLRHDHVVTVHEVLDLPQGPALLLDLVDGPSLDVLLERSGPLGEAHADELAAGLFRGLAAAHAADVVHRDLKPQNVLVGRDARGRPVARLTDFGFAKAVVDDSGARSMTGMFGGTPAYMAPEQARDAKHVDARADVFSLGAVLYRMVVGKDAFGGRSLWGIVEAVQAGTYVDPADAVPGLPERQARAIREALRTEPDERVATVEALAALWFAGPAPGRFDARWPAAWLAPQPAPESAPSPAPAPPASARPAGGPERPERPERRRRGRRLHPALVPGLLLAIALAAVLVIGGGASSARVRGAAADTRISLVGDGGAFEVVGTGEVEVPPGRYELRAGDVVASLEVGTGEAVVLGCEAGGCGRR